MEMLAWPDLSHRRQKKNPSRRRRIKWLEQHTSKVKFKLPPIRIKRKNRNRRILKGANYGGIFALSGSSPSRERSGRRMGAHPPLEMISTVRIGPAVLAVLKAEEIPWW